MIFLTVISSIGATAGFFVSLVLLFRDPTRSTQTVVLALCTALTGATMLEDALISSRVYDHTPWFFGWSYPAFALIAPLLSLYVSVMANPAGADWRRIRGQLLIAGGLLALLTPWYLAGGAVRWAIELGLPMSGRFAEIGMYAIILYMLGTAGQQAFGFITAARRAPAIIEPGRRKWVVILTRLALIGWSVYAVNLGLSLFGLSNALILSAVNFVLAVSLYSLALLAILEPPDPLTQPVRQQDVQAKYARSAVSSEDLELIMSRVMSASRCQKIHRESNLTLQKLAAATRTSPNRLSQALNVQAGGFHEWLAQTRIQDVLVVMSTEGETSSLLDAAFLVGFNSKSTFYEAFKRATGQTPAAWLKTARDRKPPIPNPAEGVVVSLKDRQRQAS